MQHSYIFLQKGVCPLRCTRPLLLSLRDEPQFEDATEFEDDTSVSFGPVVSTIPPPHASFLGPLMKVAVVLGLSLPAPQVADPWVQGNFSSRYRPLLPPALVLTRHDGYIKGSWSAPM